MSANNLPYFISWTAQSKAITLPLDRVDQDHFYEGVRKWLNLSSISYQASFGLKNKEIISAIKRQSQSFSMASPKHTFPLKEEVSLRLIEKAGSGFKCFFVQSGSEGIENALKMARQLSGKKIVLAQKNSYHGATMGALSLTGDWRNDSHTLPRQWTKRFPCPSTDPDAIKLEQIILKTGPEKIAALCLETITGGNGVFIPPQSWFSKLRQLQKKYKFLVILDEVVCAGHRTGPFFGFQNYKGISPDFVVTAKAMTGGYFPLGVVLVKKKHASYYNNNTLSCGLTNYAHPLGLAALKAVLDLTDNPNFLKGLKEREMIFNSFFLSLKKRGLQARSIGLLGAIEVGDTLKIKDLFKNGLYCGLQNQRVILAPSLLISKNNLVKGLKTLEGLLHDKTISDDQ